MAGFYERTIFPWLNDKLGGTADVVRLRAEVLAPARGRVLEIGFGSGANLPHYPAAVESIVGIEPNPGMHARAVDRVKGSRCPVEMLLAGAETLPLPDHSIDTAVSTLTLCSVSDPDRVLSELRRVVRPDGMLLVLEHGLSPDPGVARWQNRLNGLEKALFCGCHLNRAVAPLLSRHGFHSDGLRGFYLANAPRTHGWFTMGTATLRGL